jgi:hypothetical protein
MRRGGPGILAAAAMAAPLLLGGCAAWRSYDTQRIFSEDRSATERACLEEARNAPAVRALDREVNPMASNFIPQERVVRDKRLAESRALRDCLRRAGVPDPGGVEPIVPR